MDDYISREAVLGCLYKTMESYHVKRNIMDIPAADVRPVVHGKWLLYEGNGKRQYMCSVCCAEEKSPKVALFCYHCGAKMK